MLSRTSAPTRVVLPLSAAILAALVIIAVSSSPGVVAHPCEDGLSPADTHRDAHGVACSEDSNHDQTANVHIWIDPVEGRRGDTFTLHGSGFPKGTVTVFEGTDNAVDDGETLSATDVSTQKGSFAEEGLRARGMPGSSGHQVWVIDSEGKTASVFFDIDEYTVSFEPATAIAGEMLRINFLDWKEDPDLRDEKVAAVYIAGMEAYISGISEYEECYEYAALVEPDETGAISVEVRVPPEALTGEQTVSIYEEDALDSGTAKQRCAPDQVKGGLVNNELKARLEGNAEPIVRETVQVISQSQAGAPESDRGQNIIEVDGGRDRTIALHISPPRVGGGGYTGEGDQIEITLPGFDLAGASFDSDAERGRVKFSGSEDESSNRPDDPSPTRIDVDELAGTLTLTLPRGVSVAHGDGEYLIATINEGTGILTPEVPKGFDNPDEGYLVGITLIDRDAGQPSPNHETSDENIVVVKNPISSSVPSEIVRVELIAYAETEIGPGEEITVDFSGPSPDSDFVVPPGISVARITIDPLTQASFRPTGLLVRGASVTMTIPSGTRAKSIPEGEFSITFSPSARIKNPFSAGNKVIAVSSTAQGDEPDEITAVIERTTVIDTLEGPRGTEFTLEGKGYSQGTVTVYHDANDNRRIDAGETLAAVNTVRGAFSVDLIARGRPGDLLYPVRTKDSEGVDDEVVFVIRSGMFFKPATARVGIPLQITISDWQDPRQEVAAVRLAGEDAYIARAQEYENCFQYAGSFQANAEGAVAIEIDVPRFVPGGQQTVAVYGHEQLEHIDEDGNVLPDKEPCSRLPEGEPRGAAVAGNVKTRLKSEPIAIIKNTIEIDTQDLELTPPTAARGQKVTITGSGFGRSGGGSGHIDSVWIGGKKVVDDHSRFEVGTDGDLAFAVTVPLDAAHGRNEVRIEGTDHTIGQAELNVPQAAITLDPAESQLGSEFKVTGSGFIANEPVVVTYSSGPTAAGKATHLAQSGLMADSQGGFELTLIVPVAAEAGRDHLVSAVAEVNTGDGTVLVNAEARHMVAQADIETEPVPVSPGDHVTIRGQRLPAFTPVGPVSIAGMRVLASDETATNGEGSFEAKVLVPLVDYGDHTLVVQVAGVIVTGIIKVAPPPLSGPPDQVFKYLIRTGALRAVWQHDNAIQEWNLFDPTLDGVLTELNDLAEIGSGDIVWINLEEPQHFQDKALAAGWNLISLK